MDLKLTVIGNNAVSQTKQERQPDNTVKTSTANLSRISARDEHGNILQFTTDYESGKAFELGRVLNIPIQ